jgi:hypothetical protein
MGPVLKSSGSKQVLKPVEVLQGFAVFNKSNVLEI